MSDTVFIDFFAQGPVGVATQITSPEAFTRIFGGLDQRSEASYAIQQFFLNGGRTAWVVRVIDTTSGASTRSASATYTFSLGADTSDGDRVITRRLGRPDPNRLRYQIPGRGHGDATGCHLVQYGGAPEWPRKMAIP